MGAAKHEVGSGGCEGLEMCREVLFTAAKSIRRLVAGSA
jgi:hypothetical protein